MSPGLLAAIAALLASEAVPASRERVAVLLLPSVADQTSLADNLTEVAISQLAERRLELVGTPELRRFLAAGDDPSVGLLCVNQPACLARLGVVLGVRKAVIGSLRTSDTRYLLTVSLVSVDTAKVEAVFFRDVDGGLDALIRAIQDGIQDLFRPRPAPSRIRVRSAPEGAEVSIDRRYLGNTPVLSPGLDPGVHSVQVEMPGRFPWKNQVYLSPGQDLDIALNPDQLASRRRWAPPLAYGAAAGAVASLVLAVVLANLAAQAPSGRTRVEAQNDLDVREGYARDANLLLVAGAGFAAISAYSCARFWRDIWSE